MEQRCTNFHPSPVEDDLFAIIPALSQCHSIGRGDPCLHPKVVGRQRLGEGDESVESDESSGPFLLLGEITYTKPSPA